MAVPENQGMQFLRIRSHQVILSRIWGNERKILLPFCLNPTTHQDKATSMIKRLLAVNIYRNPPNLGNYVNNSSEVNHFSLVLDKQGSSSEI